MGDKGGGEKGAEPHTCQQYKSSKNNCQNLCVVWLDSSTREKSAGVLSFKNYKNRLQEGVLKDLKRRERQFGNRRAFGPSRTVKLV